MKIATLVISILLCLFMVIVPIFETVAFANDLDFALHNEKAIVWAQTIASLVAFIAMLIMHDHFNLAGKIFCMLLPPIAIWNAMCFVNSEWMFSIFFGLVWVGLIVAIYAKCVPDGVFKAISAVVSVLLGISLVVLYLIYGIFQPVVNQRTVYDTQTSPDGKYIAEMTLNESPISQSTVVQVKAADPQKETFMGVYKYKSVDVYEGEAHEIHIYEMSWKDNSTLIINGNEYAVEIIS